MDDKKLKDMWTQMNNYINFPFYGIESIEKFLERKSSSIFTKIRQNIRAVFIFQAIGIIFIIMDILFYYPNLIIVSLSIAALLVFLIIVKYEIDTLRTITNLERSTKNVQENLTGLHDFIIKNRIKMVLSYVSANIIVFPAGVLFYFYLVYGQIKPMPVFGFFVFGMIHIVMIIGAYVLQDSQLDFHRQHIKACIEDFDDQSKMLVSNQIEEKQKQDERVKVIVIAIFLVILLIIVSILKKNGVG